MVGSRGSDRGSRGRDVVVNGSRGARAAIARGEGRAGRAARAKSGSGGLGDSGGTIGHRSRRVGNCDATASLATREQLLSNGEEETNNTER